MAHKGLVAVVVFLGVLLMTAMVVPSMIAAVDGTNEATFHNLSTGDEIDITDNNPLILDVVAVNATDDNATIDLTDNDTKQTIRRDIDNGQSAIYAFDGGNVTVAVTSVTAAVSDEVSVTVTYPTEYGLSDEATLLLSTFPILILTLGFIVAGSVIISVVVP